MDRQTPFFRPGGTMDPGAPSYIERAADAQLLQALLAGEYVFLLDSRQKGKSSLVARTIVKLKAAGVATIKLDLQRIGANVTPEQWYAGMLSGIGQELGIVKELFDYWESKLALGPLARWIGALEEIVLKGVKSPIVIFIDEIDFVRALSFSTDEFFAGIRECFNRRSEESGFERLTFCLVGVATPGQLIRNPEITPFNIGTRIDLSDFTIEETLSFAAELTAPDRDGHRLVRRVHHWVNGHPYLTQLLCSRLAANQEIRTEHCIDRLVAKLFFTPEARQREPNFADIERRMLDPDVPGLTPEERRTQVLELYGRVLKGKKVGVAEENPVVATLRLSGVGLEDRRALRVRNRLYGVVFDERWRRQSLPDAELRRQQGSARLAVLRTATVASIVVLAVTTAAIGMWQLSGERQQALDALKKRTADLAETSGGRQRALTTLENRSKELAKTSSERSKALSALEQRNQQLGRLSAERQHSLTDLQRRTEELKRVSNERQGLIAGLETNAAELRRQNYTEKMGSMRYAMAAGLWQRVGDIVEQTRSDPHRNWEWGHAATFLEVESEAKVTANSRFEIQPDGKVLVVASDGLYDLTPQGARLRKPFELLSTADARLHAASRFAGGPARTFRFRRGNLRVWRDYLRSGDSIRDAESNHELVPAKPDTYILDVNPARRTYLLMNDKTLEKVELRSIDDDHVIADFTTQRRFQDIRFVADGSLIGTCLLSDTEAKTELRRWDASGRTLVVVESQIPYSSASYKMNLSPDNSLFAVSGGPVGEIRRTRDLSLVTTLPTLPKQFQAFAFSPDNRLVAMANESGAVRLFDLQHDRLQRSFVGRSSILDVAFLPDGKRLASINWYGEVKVWNMESRLPMETFFDSPAGAGVIRDLKGNLFLDFKSYVTRDGKTLVSQSKDGTVESRNLATGEVSRRNVDKQEGKPTLATAGEQTNSVFLRFQDCSVAKLDANGLKEELRTQVFTGGDMRFKVLPGGRRLLAYLFGEGHQRDNCAILDTQSLKVISRFRWKDMPDLMSPLFLGSSKDASLVAFGTGGTRLSLFTTANGKLVHVLNLYGQLRTLAFSPDGAEIAISTDNPSDSASGRIELFDTHTGKKSSVIDSVSVHRMAYSPTRRQLVGAGPAGLMLFDLKKKQKIAAQYLGVAMIQQFALSPDGERIITNGRLSSEITFWDARTLSELMSLTYTPSVPYGQAIQYNLDRCRFSPDGRDVVAFCTDGAVRIWHSLPWKDQPKAVRK